MTTEHFNFNTSVQAVPMIHPITGENYIVYESVPPVVNGPQVIGDIKVVNSNGGVKADGAKVRPTLLLKSMPKAVQAVIKVLDDGAKKYSPDNWKKVEPQRYDDAMLRHSLAYLSGEKLDQESKSPHLAHLICCALFLLEMQLEESST